MTASKDDLVKMLKQVKYDLSVTQTRVAEIAEAVALLDLPSTPKPVCPRCQITQRNALALAEHVYNAHNGPVPEHYLAAERRAGLDLESEAA